MPVQHSPVLRLPKDRFPFRQVRSQANSPHHHDWQHSLGGRVSPLLHSFIRNLILAHRWIQSTTFASYMLSRVIGGLSEGNVQLAMYVLHFFSVFHAIPC